MATNAAIKAALERGRADKVVGQSLQSAVTLVFRDRHAADVHCRHMRELDALFVVSEVLIAEEEEEISPLASESPEAKKWSYSQDIVVLPTTGKEEAVAVGTAVVKPPRRAKCPRCWRYVAPAPDMLCFRCADVVQSL